MRDNLIDNAYTKMWIENGIMHSIFKPNLVMNVGVAKILVQDLLKISGDRNWLLFFDITNLVSVDLESIQYLSTTEALCNITAGAIFTTAPIARFAGKLFVDLNRPKPPAQLFSNKTEAIAWLEQYK